MLVNLARTRLNSSALAVVLAALIAAGALFTSACVVVETEPDEPAVTPSPVVTPTPTPVAPTSPPTMTGELTTLSFNSRGLGEVTTSQTDCRRECDVEVGTLVHLWADPEDGYGFDKWYCDGGSCEGLNQLNPNISVRLSGRRTHFVAEFSYSDDHGNIRERATRIRLGETVRGQFDYHPFGGLIHEVDYFRFDVPGSGKLTIEVTDELGNPIRVGYSLDNPRGRLIYDDIGYRFDPVSVQGAGTHYVSLAAPWPSNNNSPAEYILTVSFNR